MNENYIYLFLLKESRTNLSIFPANDGILLFTFPQTDFPTIIEIFETHPFIDSFHLPVVHVDTPLCNQAPCLSTGSG
jgi:hypothetical protein